MLDIIDTKTYKFKQITPKTTEKRIWIVRFHNKTLEAIRLPKIFNHPDIIKTLLYNLRGKDSIPIVTYKLGKTIRNNILNYKDAVNSIYVDEEVSLSLNTDLCDSEKSSDPHHKHIIIVDLRILKNQKLRKLLTRVQITENLEV